MTPEQQYWAKIWKYIITAIVFIIFSFVANEMYENYKITEAIKSGADPVQVRIAFELTPHELRAILKSQH